VAGLDARYLYQEKAGAPAARQRGAELAKGEYIAFLDADDVWYSDKLHLQVEAFERNPEKDMIFGHMEEFVSPDCVASASRRVKEYAPGYVPGTLLITAEAFLKVGGFAAPNNNGDFFDWYVQSQKQGLDAKMLPDIVLRHRLHQAIEGVQPRVAGAPTHGHRHVAPVLKSAVDLLR
jgi:glycosyltransferase involved in cell wall biosynthesis